MNGTTKFKMNLEIIFLLLTLCLVNVSSQKGASILEELFLPKFRVVRKSLYSYLKTQNHSPRNIRNLQEKKAFQEEFPQSFQFPCNVSKVKTSSNPKSVHELRPSDIKIIGALGDSLSAGNGLTAYNLVGVLLEDRGRSFPIGGEKTWRQFLTVPNILKEFNPNLIGYSLGTSLTIEWNSQFNVAEAGAISSDMPYMSGVLIKRIKNDKRINWEKDWKLITIFIGCNDFCAELCAAKDPTMNLEQHRKDLLNALRNLRDNLPNTIVNVIPPPNLQVLLHLDNKPSHCDFTHSFECECLFQTRYLPQRQLYIDIMSKWQRVDLEVANAKEFDLDNFTVVAQPFFLNYTFPMNEKGEKDLSYLAYDCFHFSQKGQAKVALDYWNNILEPVGKKSMDGSKFFEKFNCPSKDQPDRKSVV